MITRKKVRDSQFEERVGQESVEHVEVSGLVIQNTCVLGNFCDAGDIIVDEGCKVPTGHL